MAKGIRKDSASSMKMSVQLGTRLRNVEKKTVHFVCCTTQVFVDLRMGVPDLRKERGHRFPERSGGTSMSGWAQVQQPTVALCNTYPSNLCGYLNLLKLNKICSAHKLKYPENKCCQQSGLLNV